MATTLSFHKKAAHILDHEELTAHRLARLVLEKPVPPLWMILMPIFFVFHAWRIKQYSAGLKDFADNYLISRRKALDIARQCQETEEEQKPDRTIAELAESVPTEARQPYQQMMTLLVSHYRGLLSIRANSLPGLIRLHYRNKTNYMLYCKNLNDAENRLNLALLPKIEGNRQDLDLVIGRMKKGVEELQRIDADQFFL